MPVDEGSENAAVRGVDPCSRRRFLTRTCAVIAGLGLSAGTFTVAGCDSGGGLPSGVDTTLFPDLARPDGFLWIADADVIVLHDDALGYRAFSSRCPHEGKDVRQSTAPRCAALRTAGPSTSTASPPAAPSGPSRAIPSPQTAPPWWCRSLENDERPGQRRQPARP